MPQNKLFKINDFIDYLPIEERIKFYKSFAELGIGGEMTYYGSVS